MKKIFVILMLALLIVGISPVFAAGPKFVEVEDVGSDSKIDSEKPEETASTPLKPYGKAIMKGEKKMVAQQVQANVKEKVQERMKEVKEFQLKLKDCKYSTSEECKEVKAQAKKKAHGFLVTSVEKTLAFLEKAKEKIINSKLSEEEKNTALTELNAKMEELTGAKDQLMSSEEIDRKELREAVGNIRNSWGKVRSAIAHKLHRAYAQKFGNTIEKIDKVDEKLADKIKKLEAKGVDVSNVATAAFDDKVAEAKAAYEQAETLLDQAKDSTEEDSKELMKQAREKLKESHEFMKQAREELKNILQQLRDAIAKKQGQ